MQLHVKGYIRSDVVFQPGEASFGSIMQGEAKSIEVAVDYAGKPTWQITKVTAGDSFINVTAKEVSRQSGRVRYMLDVAMSGDAPAGPLESELVVHTNDRNLSTIPIRLVANINAEISVSPKTLSLGDIVQGEAIKQMVILKGHKPFVVKSVQSDVFAIDADLREESKPLHAFPIMIKPNDAEYGKEITGAIVITTDLPEKPTIEIGTVFRLKATVPE